MNNNCFTVGYTGLTAGFRLTLKKPGYGGRMLPPHLAIGGVFARRDQHDGCRYYDGLVYHADLNQIKTESGKAFYTLVDSNGEDGRFFVFVQTNLPPRVTLRQRPQWSGLTTSGEIAVQDSGEYLICLQDGQSATAFFPEGKVIRLVCQGQTVALIQLDQIEMVTARTKEAKLQLQDCTSDERGMRKRHGIIWGILSLLDFHPTGHIAVIIAEFLRYCGEEGMLTVPMRKKARQGLESCGEHLIALEIGSGGDVGHNVVDITGGHRGAPKERQAQLAARAARDREYRNAHKGTGKNGKKRA